jgi:tRNA-specific 2-thiouridylase
MVTPVGESDARVLFETPEPAVTPGQGAVFYQGDEVLGGGWIE